MTGWKRVAVAVAALALLLGVLSANAIPLEVPRSTLLPIGIGSLLVAFWVAVEPTVTTERGPSPAEPELPTALSVPGASFDDELAAEAGNVDRENSHARQRIRDRLRSVAIGVLTAFGRRTREEAIAHLESGTWTDDPVAAAFLRGEVLTPRPDWRRRLRSAIGAPNPFRDAVRRTVAALTRYAGRRPAASSKPGWLDRIRGVAIGSGPSGERQETGDERDRSADVPRDRSLDTWAGAVALSFACLGAGLLLTDPGILLASGIGVCYVAYARVSTPPSVPVAIDRRVDDATPDPGDAVRVTLSIRNEGDALLPHLRIVDGVPSGLGVEAGSPRLATPLRPDEEATLAYAVRARRGVHEFESVRVAVRDVAETAERRTEVDAGGPDLVCRPPFGPTVGRLRREVTRFVGGLPTDSGGDGIEFYSLREYRRGDPLSKIDWKRLARTRELATVTFREERATTVICVVDARASAFVAPEPRDESALDRSVHALARLFPALREAGNRVGLAAFGPEPCWIDPSASSEARSRVREAVTSHPAFPTAVSEGECYTLDWIEEFRRRYDRVQVVFVTPLVDEGARVLARRLEIHGYPTTVLSVDPTTTDSVGRQLAYLERRARLHDLREAGVRVVNWEWGDPLDLAFAAADWRWSP